MLQILRILIPCLMLISCGGGDGGSSNTNNASSAVSDNTFCDGKSFPAPENTFYILPWPAGTSYTMFQGNCSEKGGHRDTFAYDFDLRMGDPIYASRAGTVTTVVESNSDDDHTEGHENRVNVTHADGTVMWYVHLMQDSAFVEVGQEVRPGDILGLAGNSGNSSGPHLHQQLFRDGTSFDKSNALPIAFSNAEGRKQNVNELIEDELYIASDPSR